MQFSLKAACAILYASEGHRSFWIFHFIISILCADAYPIRSVSYRRFQVVFIFIWNKIF